MDRTLAQAPVLSARFSGHRHQIVAGTLASVILATALTAMPFGRLALPVNPSFLPAFGAMTLVSELITGCLLLSQARLAKDRAPLRLAVAYLFSAAALIPHFLAFPGVVAPTQLIGATASAVWLWCAWHGGFGVLVLAFALGRPRRLRRWDIAVALTGVAMSVFALAWVATTGLRWLPVILVDGNFDRITTLGIAPTILLVTCLAACVVVVKQGLRDPLSLWLSVSILAAILDVALTMTGGGRYTLGWYLSRTLSLITGLTVLIALLYELVIQAGRVAEVNAELETMLRTDVLTGLANRRAFETAVSAEWRRARREQTATSMLMIDIDLFKGFNDRYGHPAGDVCLCEVAAALSGQTRRPGHLAARIGGEEFVVLLPNTEEAGATQVAERMRASVAALNLTHAGSALGHVTISIGVATRRPIELEEETSSLMDAADSALYQAKAAGRNTVCAAEAMQSSRLLAAECIPTESW
jgi:diguanylate cyclase (GGDEF)-like protein